MSAPGATEPALGVFRSVRSGPPTGEVMTIGLVAVLLPVFVSPPPDTTAVFVTATRRHTRDDQLVVTVMSG